MKNLGNQKFKNKNNQFVNTARGMVNDSVTNTINQGDYIRGNKLTGNIYKKMNEIAKESNRKQYR